MGDMTSMFGFFSNMEETSKNNKQNTLNWKANKEQLEAEEGKLKSEASQIRKNASETRALGQRDARDARLEGDVILSNARAAMAAGGGSTTDAGAIKTLAQIEDRVEYNALGRLFESNLEADKLLFEASQKDKERKQVSRNKKWNNYQGVLGHDMTIMV